MLQAMAEEPVLQGATQMWASVQGGRHIELRSENAAAATSRQGVQGVVIGGLGTGDQTSLTVFVQAAVIQHAAPSTASWWSDQPGPFHFATSALQ